MRTHISCAGRSFEAAPAATTPASFAVFETSNGRAFRFYARSLDQARRGIAQLVAK